MLDTEKASLFVKRSIIEANICGYPLFLSIHIIIRVRCRCFFPFRLLVYLWAVYVEPGWFCRIIHLVHFYFMFLVQSQSRNFSARQSTHRFVSVRNNHYAMNRIEAVYNNTASASYMWWSTLVCFTLFHIIIFIILILQSKRFINFLYNNLIGCFLKFMHGRKSWKLMAPKYWPHTKKKKRTENKWNGIDFWIDLHINRPHHNSLYELWTSRSYLFNSKCIYVFYFLFRSNFC